MKYKLITLFFAKAAMCLSLSVNADSLAMDGMRHRIMADFLNRQVLDYTERNNIPNAVVAMVTVDSIHLLQGYGYADLDNRVTVDPSHHLFRTGSVSKIFTWTAILQLSEKGLVDLDADISEYLDIEINHKILYTEGDPAPISLRHLLTHTAGYEDVLEGLFSFSPQPSLKQQLLTRVPARIYPPGQVMAYSNWGASLAGYIVENVSGMRFEDYVKQHIFRPLGMNRSTFEQPLESEFESRMVNAYRWVDGNFYEGNFEHMPAPAGGLSTTAYDMALFLQAHLAGGGNAHGKILERATIEKLHSTQFTYHPLLAGMTFGMIEMYVNGNRIVSHGGSSSIFDSGFYLIPEAGIGLFFAYSGGEISGHVNILHDFVSEFFPKKEKPYTNYSPLIEATLADLKGEYHQSRSMRTSSDRILNLMIGSLNLDPVTNNELGFNLYDMDFSYREIKPGMYKSNLENKGYPFGIMEFLLVAKASDGRLMLVTDGPMTFIKARWYERASFAGWLFIPAIVLAIGSLLFFGIRLIVRRFSKRLSLFKGDLLLGNRLVVAHAATLLLTVIVFIVNSKPHPAHRLPESFFDINPLLEGIVNGGVMVVGILAALLLVSSVRIWLKKHGRTVAKVYHGVYTLWALGFLWLGYFYNLFMF